jgi:predicted MFS family arabinose efflux permease
MAGLALQNRWTVLAVLAFARSSVGYQFIAIAALMPQLKAALGFNYTQLGTLLGVFMIVGMFLSLPVGLLVPKMGDRLTLWIGLGSMVAGGLLIALSEAYFPALIGRILGGVGAVATSVVGSKQLTDWFFGKEIRTAMSIYGVMWTTGIGLGMSLLPFLSEQWGWTVAVLSTTTIPALAIILVSFIPPNSAGPGQSITDHVPPRLRWTLDKREVFSIVAAGAAWPLMNGGGYVLFTSYGPSLLIERGSTAVSAGLIVGMLSWLVMATIPIGGLMADRSGRSGLLFLVGCFISAAAIGAVPFGGPVALWVLLSAAIGLTVGPVMALPSDLLRTESRAAGFGLLYSLFYTGMGVLPAIGGWLLDWTGSISAVIWFSAACLIAAPAPYFSARRLHKVLSS